MFTERWNVRFKLKAHLQPTAYMCLLLMHFLYALPEGMEIFGGAGREETEICNSTFWLKTYLLLRQFQGRVTKHSREKFSSFKSKRKAVIGWHAAIVGGEW